MIQINDIAFGYDVPLMQGLHTAFPDGCITGVLGPNGSGKTTLLKLCARLLRPSAGTITVDNAGAAGDSRAFARALAYLPQSRPLPAITVRSLANHGRFPHLGLSRKLRECDRAAVEDALRLTGMLNCAHRELRTLSGGQRQKAYIAMLIVQQAQHLLLDEPMNHLDVLHRMDVADILRRLRDEGRCIAVVLHDIPQALDLCDRILLLHRGEALYDGPAEGLYDSGAIQKAFGVRPTLRNGISFERI